MLSMIHDTVLLDVAHAFAQTHDPSRDAEWLQNATRLAERRGNIEVAERLTHWLVAIRGRWGTHRPPGCESRSSYLRGGDGWAFTAGHATG